MKLKGSYLWAGAIVVAIGAWLGADKVKQAVSGTPADGATETAALAGPETDGGAKAIPAVRVTVLTASERPSSLVLRGRTEALRRVEVRGETNGTVVATPAEKGAFVARGDVLCRLDMADREAQLRQARASLDWAEIDFEAKNKLGTRGFSAKNQVTQMQAARDAAIAGVARAELEIERTRIVAPFDGVVEARSAEVGSYIGTGGACATVVELSPMKVVAHVSEREVGALSVAMPASARLATGQTVEGRIRFIGSTADPATRTFRIEIEIPNADRAVKDGVTAEIAIPLKPVTAHRFSPAILTLDDKGTIGVRTVGADDVVAFVPVEIVASDEGGVWVTGLPPSPAVITVGHEYVVAGQKVRRIDDTHTASAESLR
jgi:multidrug efflux system membrane fusion protein